ncbi:hypothetical protein LOD99_6912 [Oopsacas minuta]|uniref:PH domain-containing protein n=1 Tax=Oopsacas minuta TaxID=111878 RepID=A0AAV7JKT6_9METZ|nr:hypothetical protein LOD99_6912 [Oopsacas minuta]
MASSPNYYSPQFTSKEGILHVSIDNKWKKKWIILSCSSLIIYKKKYKRKVPKLIYDLTKAIAITSPIITEQESHPMPPKIPFFRGFAIRFNGMATQTIFAAFAFSHLDCLQWVQSIRLNTNSIQQLISISPSSNSDCHRPCGYGIHSLNVLSPPPESIPSSHNNQRRHNLTYPEIPVSYFCNPKSFDKTNQLIDKVRVIESIERQEDIKPEQIPIRSSSMCDLSQPKVEYDPLQESENLIAIPLPPPYNPNYD